ncbi:bifunctional tryptophan synthase trp1 [Geranomyces michiganensis]|nr:bifunctional tryptophan synthase trp1 [Geranomyces michiganensis]
MDAMGTPAPRTKTLLIDNYDSFTWNVYQYLSEMGADVVVYRNDQVTLEECVALNPRNVVISPGPGRPADAAISNDVIRHFAGKVPVLGVCLGEQCMFEIWGGTVTYAGEIVHGKTTPVLHDGKGLYEGVEQAIECTRYHSLVGDASTLPAELVLTSWIEGGMVMGVRHRRYVVEGVQYHPESIASEGGRKIFANFLKWEGGTWDDLKIREDLVKWPAPAAAGGKSKTGAGIALSEVSKMNSTGTTGTASNEKKSILETIHDQRLRDVRHAASQPGQSHFHLQRSIALGLAPPSIDFAARVLASAQPVAVMGEIKRASPSKGDIDLYAHAATQALQYANGGAAVISVLTEPTWFKGSLEDMRQVRAALDTVPNRPAVLRKDFIVDRYQVLEARLYGADTLLLIVAILTNAQIADLLAYSRALGMEPMVEVANEAEMRRAIDLGSKVIGVNNRDLHTFAMDMNRTSNLSGMVPQDVILVALSGITGRKDVETYVKGGAKAVLVGEALMRSRDKGAFIGNLLGLPHHDDCASATPVGPLIKMCGITSVEDAIAATEAGANVLGFIFAKSARNITPDCAKNVVAGLYKHLAVGESKTTPLAPPIPATGSRTSTFLSTTDLRNALIGRKVPLLVGVFSNHSISDMRSTAEMVGLDFIQFHGDEPADSAFLLPRPVIKAIHVFPTDTAASVLAKVRDPTYVGLGGVLLDSAATGVVQQGGSGVVFDWTVAAEVERAGVQVWLAGGLAVKNVAEAVKKVHPAVVDVCSGVEVDGKKGVKDVTKMKAFVKAVREAARDKDQVFIPGSDD